MKADVEQVERDGVITLEVFQAQLRAQGVPHEHFAFKCPMCGTVQSATSLIRAGAGSDFGAVEKYLGFSCVGRWTGGPGPSEAKKLGVACNWTLGGLFQCHTLEVKTPDGEHHPRFELAAPAEAKALMEQNLANRAAGFVAEQANG